MHSREGSHPLWALGLDLCGREVSLAELLLGRGVNLEQLVVLPSLLETLLDPNQVVSFERLR